MRYVIKAAIVLSVIAVLWAIYGVALTDSRFDALYSDDSDDDPFWPLAGLAALIASVALAFIWLAVFVIYVVVRGVRVARGERL